MMQSIYLNMLKDNNITFKVLVIKNYIRICTYKLSKKKQNKNIKKKILSLYVQIRCIQGHKQQHNYPLLTLQKSNAINL